MTRLPGRLAVRRLHLDHPGLLHGPVPGPASRRPAGGACRALDLDRRFRQWLRGEKGRLHKRRKAKAKDRDRVETIALVTDSNLDVWIPDASGFGNARSVAAVRGLGIVVAAYESL